MSERALVWVVRMISKALRVDVRFDPMARTASVRRARDGKSFVILLPALPPGDKTAAVLVPGWVVHEAAHARFTDFTLGADATPRQEALHQMLEDLFIERQVCGVYAGARPMLHATWSMLYELGRVTRPGDQPNEHVFHDVACWVLAYCRAHALGLAPAIEDLPRARANVVAHLGEETAACFEQQLQIAPWLNSTAETYAHAATLLQTIGLLERREPQQSQAQQQPQQQEPQQPQPGQQPQSQQGQHPQGQQQPEQPAPQDGADEQGGQAPAEQTEPADQAGAEEGQSAGTTDQPPAQAEGAASAQDAAASDDANGPPPGEPGPIDESTGASPQDGDQAAQGDPLGEENAVSGEAPGQAQADDAQAEQAGNAGAGEEDGEPVQSLDEEAMAQADACAQQMGDPLADAVPDLLGEVLRAYAVQQEEDRRQGKPVRVLVTGASVEPRTDGHDGRADGAELQRRARAATTALAAQITHLMRSLTESKETIGRVGRPLASELWRLRTGNANVFELEEEGIDPDTAVALLLDVSGSMRSGARLALTQMTAMAIIDAVEGVNGVKTAVYSFPGVGGDHRVDGLKALDERAQRANGAIASLRASGGTPLAEALYAVGPELAACTQAGKVLLVVTDGEPNDPQAARGALQAAKAQGIDVIGIGVQADVVPLFERGLRIDDIGDLPRTLFAVLSERLEEQIRLAA